MNDRWDAWKDSYDEWKTREPDHGEEEEQSEESRIEEDCYHNGYTREQTEKRLVAYRAAKAKQIRREATITIRCTMPEPRQLDEMLKHMRTLGAVILGVEVAERARPDAKP